MFGIVACGPATAPPQDADAGTSTGEQTSGSPSTAPGTSSSSTVASTTSSDESDSSSGGTMGSDSSSGAPEPVVTCREQGCSRSCTFMSELDLDSGDVCECTKGEYAEDFVACELPPVCSGKGHYCIVQALRYGIAGTFSGMAGDVDAFEELTVEILGDGRARSLVFSQEHGCCDGMSVNTEYREGYPVAVRGVDDAFWADCFAEIPGLSDFELPSCYVQTGFGTGQCEGTLDVCPDVTAHVPGCDAECPMANDGVCDESIGTGLCGDGCDPVDCACPDDVEGECNEVPRGGVCPLGSDADDCPGIDPF